MTRREFLYAVPAAAGIAPLALGQSSQPPPHQWTLWYREPAGRWLDALPVGNGRLGAMMFGGVETETIALNESTLWSGSPNESGVNPTALEHMGEMRRLLFEGKYAQANELCAHHLTGREHSYGTHLPLAKLLIESLVPPSGTPADYRRSLDIEAAIAQVTYGSGGVQWSREMFASNPDNIIAIRLGSNQKGCVSCAVSLDPGDLPGEVFASDDNTLVLAGSAWEKKHSDGGVGVNFQTWVRVVTEGGRVVANGSRLEIRNADAAVLLVAAHTNYGGADITSACKKQIEAAAGKGYGTLRENHVADHRRLFQRVSIDLGGSDAGQQPTNDRRVAVGNGASDPQLSALFFQFGRYLLIAGSRENSPLPLNLQGIWNDSLAAKMAWTCDFHLDINTQQNYWPSEVCNLSECGEPLFRLVERLSEQGRATARNMYGAPGWVCHVYTNAWGFTAPGVGVEWGPFVTGGIWTAWHLWEHYLFTGDRDFLRRRAYPVLKSATEFFLDYMVEHPTRKWLVTGPSISPENQFLSPDGVRCSLSMGPTCDRELVFALFTACIESSKTLALDGGFRERIISARARLAPLQIGKYGQLQEWLEDFEEAVPNHRHTSHLLALYPLDQITPEKTPSLAKAALVTIERRTGHKDWEDVEWSRANLINFFARLQQGDDAHKHLVGLLREDTDRNLMTFSRAGVAGAGDNIFAIDGNTAGAAGMAEMLLQSHADIRLLPALPQAWPSGSVSGLCARGGFRVTLHWDQGALTSAVIGSSLAGTRTIRYRDHVASVNFKAGASIHFDPTLKLV